MVLHKRGGMYKILSLNYWLAIQTWKLNYIDPLYIYNSSHFFFMSKVREFAKKQRLYKLYCIINMFLSFHPVLNVLL
jgi:hypothetical protein